MLVGFAFRAGVKRFRMRHLPANGALGRAAGDAGGREGDANAAPSKVRGRTAKRASGWPVGSVKRSPCLPVCLRRRDGCLCRWMDWIRRRHTATGMKAPYSMTRRAMSLRAAWSLRTLPTTRHRCRCVFSQAAATSMPSGFSVRVPALDQEDRDPAPLHRKGRPDRPARRSRDEDGCTVTSLAIRDVSAKGNQNNPATGEIPCATAT